jgi:hypothetical protein
MKERRKPSEFVRSEGGRHYVATLVDGKIKNVSGPFVKSGDALAELLKRRKNQEI